MLDAFSALSSEPDETRALARLVEAAIRAVGATDGDLVLLGPEAADGEVVPANARETAPDGTRAVLRIPVRHRGTTLGILSLSANGDGAGFTRHDEEIASAIAGAAGAVLDRTRAHHLGERQRRWLEATAALTDALEPPFSLARALDAVLTQACGVAGANAAAVLQQSPGEPVVLAVRGLRPDGVGAGTVSEVGDALDAAARYLKTRGVPTEDVEVDGGSGLLAVIVPLRSHVAVDGVLVVVHVDEARAHDFDERQLLSNFAEQAGLSLDRAQAIEDRRSLDTVSERERAARELNDVVIQRLFATGLRLQALQYAAPGDIAEPLSRAVDDLDATIKDIRSTVFRIELDRA